MDDAIAIARAAWPSLQFDEHRFRAHLEEMKDPIAHPADLCLAWLAARGDPAAVALFEEHFVARARTRIRAVDAEPALLEEARQRLRAQLLAGPDSPLAGYAGRGPLAAWVGISLARIGLALEKERTRPGPALEEPVPPDPELDFLRLKYREEFAAAFRAALGAVPERERTMLRLAYFEGVPLEGIGRLYGKHASSISRDLRRIREQILARTREALAAQLRIEPSEVDSLMRLLRSEVEISIRRWI